MEVRASIAMAVCNGELYIREQIDSILNMMEPCDELVISYDSSQDRTLEIIKEYEQNDKRIHVYYDEGRSVESNFNNAVKHTKGKYIFLADQDDVWINDKINRMIEEAQKDKKAVVWIGDGYLCNKNLEIIDEISKKYKTSVSGLRNFIKGSYLGCQMMFVRDIKDKIWPVQTEPPLAHDLWLGILGSKYGKVVFLDEKYILHRLYEFNFSNTSKMNAKNVMLNRIELWYQLRKRIKKNKRIKNEDERVK